MVYWLLMLICKKKYFTMVLGAILWYAIHVIFCIKMKYGIWWYVYSNFLILGMLWATYEHRIVDFIKRNYFIIALLSELFFVIFVFFPKVIAFSFHKSHALIVILWMSAFFFVIGMLIFFMKVQIGNKILNFLGDISLEIYISHWIFIISLRNGPLYIKNDMVYSLFVLTATILFSYILHLLHQFVLKTYKKWCVSIWNCFMCKIDAQIQKKVEGEFSLDWTPKKLSQLFKTESFDYIFDTVL